MRARILPPTRENLALAARALARGEVVGMPTETVYGLAGAALRPEALARIFDTKERPTFDPLILHVGPAARGVSELEGLRIAGDRPGSRLEGAARARAQALIEAFWPGPLTLVLPKHADVPDLATSGLPSVAVRMPSHPVARALIAEAGTPVAAPSANRFGRISPTTAAAVAEELGDRIDWILDGGACEIGVESTVVRIEADGALTQLRPGGLSRASIEQVAGCELRVAEPTSKPGAQAAPGMLESHYAPVKPLLMLEATVHQLTSGQWRGLARRVGGAPCALLLIGGDTEAAAALAARELGAPVTAHGLSRDGDLTEAARNLFAGLRAIDASEARILLVEPCSIDRGLGHAIADRLGRASAGSRKFSG